MNLEAIEERVLAYLNQATNPLVRVEVLHAHLVDHDLAQDMSVRQLKDFLAKHDQVRIMEAPPQFVDPGSEGEPAGAFVIAKDRVPTHEQLADMMREQLDILLEALDTARKEALARGEDAHLEQIEQAQRQAALLRQKVDGAVPDNVVAFRRN